VPFRRPRRTDGDTLKHDAAAALYQTNAQRLGRACAQFFAVALNKRTCVECDRRRTCARHCAEPGWS